MDTERLAAAKVVVVAVGVPPRAHEDEHVGSVFAAEEFVALIADLPAIAAGQERPALRERGDESDLPDAAVFVRSEEHAGVPGMQWEREHPATEAGDAPVMVDCAEVFQ